MTHEPPTVSIYPGLGTTSKGIEIAILKTLVPIVDSAFKAIGHIFTIEAKVSDITELDAQLPLVQMFAESPEIAALEGRAIQAVEGTIPGIASGRFVVGLKLTSRPATDTSSHFSGHSTPTRSLPPPTPEDTRITPESTPYAIATATLITATTVIQKHGSEHTVKVSVTKHQPGDPLVRWLKAPISGPEGELGDAIFWAVDEVLQNMQPNYSVQVTYWEGAVDTPTPLGYWNSSGLTCSAKASQPTATQPGVRKERDTVMNMKGEVDTVPYSTSGRDKNTPAATHNLCGTPTVAPEIPTDQEKQLPRATSTSAPSAEDMERWNLKPDVTANETTLVAGLRVKVKMAQCIHDQLWNWGCGCDDCFGYEPPDEDVDGDMESDEQEDHGENK